MTRLQLQLREAAEREAHRSAFDRRTRDAIRSPALAGAVAAVAVLLAIGAGALLLRGDPEPAGPSVLARLELTGNPEQLIPAFGAVWIADSVAGEVVRVDPERRSVTARIPVGARQELALTQVGRELWVAGDGGPRILRIDPATNRVASRITLRTPAGDPFPAFQVLASDRAVWAVSSEGALQLDPRTGAGLRIVARPRAAWEARWITLGDGALWVYGTDGVIRRLDALSGALQARVRPALAEAQWFGVLGGDLIALNGDGNVARLDGRTGAVRWQRRIGDTLHADDYGAGRLWAYVTRPSEPSRLVALDPRDGTVASSTRIPGFSATGIAVVGGEVWVDEPGGQTVIVGQPTR